MLDLMPGMFILRLGLGFIMALGVDIALINISEEGKNNESIIVTTGQTLGQSRGTAINGAILILGIIKGVNNTVDTYVPDY